MRTAIIGDHLTEIDVGKLTECIKASGLRVSAVVTGSGSGAEKAARDYAAANKLPCEERAIERSKFGVAAGRRRNVGMVHDTEALVVIWSGFSRDIQHALSEASYLKKTVHEFIVRP